MSDDAIEPRPLRRATLALIALATLTLELATAQPDRPWWHCVLATLGLLVVPSLGLAWYLGRRPPREGGPTPVAAGALLIFFAAPFALEAGHRLLFGRGAMLEVVLLSAVRNLGLGLAVLSDRAKYARLAAVVSLFLTLIAASLGGGRLVAGLVGLYAAAGTSWLVLAYWGRVAGATGVRRLPATSLIGVAVVVLAVSVVLALGPEDAAMVLAGLLPTSGGTTWQDPDARGGVNDGDDEVAASERPESVGFTESEVYLDTDRPSLYDAFSDVYGEPYKPGETKRMIALKLGDIQEQTGRPAENLRAGREFALVRRPSHRPRSRPGDRAAQALVYVKGPTPLHLPLVAYDRFDGLTWREEAPSGEACPLEPTPAHAWMRLQRPARAIHAGTVRHQVKIGMLESSVLPLPSHPARFRVGSVNKADFFGWAQRGILRMVGRTVPAGTVLDAESRTVDPRRLADVSFVSSDQTARARGDADPDPRVAALARDWSRDVPRGWPQVEAIVAALRAHCTLDRAAEVPGDCRDTVAHFLFEARRGPDVQFATAAVVLIRSLGYRVRLVGGLYASPDRFDARTRHTPVTRDDVHFWAEVISRTGDLVAIEPTPGYALMAPAPSWSERLVLALRAAWGWARGHPAPPGLALLGIAAGFRFRREALDALATARWTVATGVSGADRVLATLRLMEGRAPRGTAAAPRSDHRRLVRADRRRLGGRRQW